MDISADLFAEYGYDFVTTIQIAEAVGCSETSIFKLFPKKDQIYEALFSEWELTVQGVPEIPIVDGSALKTLRQFFNRYRTRSVSLHKNMRPRLESAVYSRRTNNYPQRIHGVLRNQPDIVASVLAPIFAYGQKRGEIRPGDPNVLASVFWSVLWGEAYLSYDEQYQQPFQYFLPLFAAEKTEQVLQDKEGLYQF